MLITGCEKCRCLGEDDLIKIINFNINIEDLAFIKENAYKTLIKLLYTSNVPCDLNIKYEDLYNSDKFKHKIIFRHILFSKCLKKDCTRMKLLYNEEARNNAIDSFNGEIQYLLMKSFLYKYKDNFDLIVLQKSWRENISYEIKCITMVEFKNLINNYTYKLDDDLFKYMFLIYGYLTLFFLYEIDDIFYFWIGLFTANYDSKENEVAWKSGFVWILDFHLNNRHFIAFKKGENGGLVDFKTIPSNHFNMRF